MNTLLGVIALLLAIVSTCLWAADLRFYSRNGWDFKIERDSSFVKYFTHSEFCSQKMPAKERVLVGLPLMLLVSWIIAVEFLWSAVSG